ncbi:MAG TPA: hypothetical protein VKC16_07845, partial [Xanthobacteraceae bacterium]|nr:hypothetical protein [Xanthobacteraceae bacterium]
MITFHRIERSSSTGIRDHDRPEHAIGDQEPEYGAEHDSYFQQPASVHPGWKRNLHPPRTDGTVRDV